MILVSELTKTFGKGKDQKTVLDRNNWNVANGQVVGLIGRSESGKSVTARILAGIQNPTHGRVLIENHDIVEDSFEAKKDLAFVADSDQQFQGLKGEEYLNFIADIYGVSADDRKSRLHRYVKELRLETSVKEKMSDYNDKSRFKKMMLLGALLHQPKNLILDNFFDGLDEPDAKEVRKLLKEYARENQAVVLFTDKKLKAVKDFCDKVIVLRSGKVVFEGSVEKLMEKFNEETSLEMIDFLLNKGTDKVLEGKGGN